MKIVALAILIFSFSALARDGRFQFIINQQFRSESVLLDTQTGKIWQRTCLVPSKTEGGECQYSAWYPQDIVDISVSKKEIQQFLENLKKQ